MGCTQGCPYCYARRQAKRQKQNCQQCYDFTPHLHPERLEQPLHRKKPAGIFLGSMADLYDPNVPQEWRDRVWAICAATPQHRYFVLTKQPQNIEDDAVIPANVMYGFSAHNQGTFETRAGYIANVCDRGVIASIEPLLGEVWQTDWMYRGDWIIVGAETGPGAFVPPPEWVDHIARQAHNRTCAFFVKDNLRVLYPERDWPQEWPKGGAA